MNSQQRVLGAVAIAALIIAGFLFTRRFMTPMGPEKYGLEVVGEAAAEEVVRLLGGRGQVVVVFLDSKSTGLSGPERIVQKLESRLKRETGLKLLPRESVPALEPTASRRCAELARQHANVDAVVLVGGIGVAYAHDFESLTGGRPKLVSVLGFGLADTRDLLQREVLTLGIVDHPDPPAVLPDGPTAREWFAARYLVLTPQNAGQIRVEPPPATMDSAQ
jgi:hypothetical protein